ncbi:MAG TPA: zinc-binding dehydrogenase [Thermoanaerobaculia bacterium]
MDATFPFSRAPEAYRRMEDGLQHGKIVLVPDSLVGDSAIGPGSGT